MGNLLKWFIVNTEFIRFKPYKLRIKSVLSPNQVSVCPVGFPNGCWVFFLLNTLLRADYNDLFGSEDQKWNWLITIWLNASTMVNKSGGIANGKEKRPSPEGNGLLQV
jgi:hypothetical protein